MSTDQVQWYRSKVDWWLVPILCVPIVASIAVCFALVLGGKASELPWGIAGVGFVVALFLGVVFPMRYGVDETHLIVRFGLCRQRVPLANITEVYPTRNPLSSPALSLDRLYVKYGEGIFNAVMISPAEKSGFLNELAKRAGLKREGDRLLRA
jgi:hypothetical protein